MTEAERHKRVMQLFDEACELPPEERNAFLSQRCGNDEQLRCDVESLLEHDTATRLPIESMDGGKAVEWLAADLTSTPAHLLHTDDSSLPERIGAYRIVRLIGHGGMGVVYEAEQENPKRRVALKMVRPGLVGAQLRRRLQREANVLGRLQHVGIAQVYEAGLVEAGGDRLPFFAMEYIDGERITNFAATRELTTRQRLALMARVCDAVHHAHQMGVIHRDLKPANILVIPTDTDTIRTDSRTGGTSTSAMLDMAGQPKVLDFGVARVTDSDRQAVTIQTDAGQLVGTLPYMSPEQVAGDSQQLDARCDVYALGVVLFELLTNRLPLNLARTSVAEAARIIRDNEPLSAGVVDRSLRGDVDTIIAKALEKGPTQRYATAAQLAADIRRHLDDEPIEARPASAMYNLRKFARRNKGLVAGLAAAFVVLLLGVTGTTIGFVSALRANNKLQGANKELAETNRQLEETNANLKSVSEFQSDQLTKFDVPTMGLRIRKDLLNAIPADERSDIESRLGNVNFVDLARETLDQSLFHRAVEAVESQFAQQPELRATLLQDLATTMRNLGLFKSAAGPQSRALEIRRRELGDDQPDAIASLCESGNLAMADDDAEKAESLYREAIAAELRTVGENDPTVLNIYGSLAASLRRQGKLDEAERMARKSYDGLTATVGPDDPGTLDATESLAAALYSNGKYSEAVKLGRQALEGRRRSLGDDDRTTLQAIGNLSNFLESNGDLEESLTLSKEAFDESRRVLGSDHPNTLSAMTEYGGRLARQGKLNEAEPILREALQRRRHLLGNDHYETTNSIDQLVSLLEDKGKYDEAEPLARECLETRRRTLGDDNPATLRAIGNLGFLLGQTDRTAEAEPLYRETLAEMRRVYGNDHPHTLTAVGNLAALLSKMGREEEAEPLYIESLEGRRRLLGDDNPSTLNAIYNMGAMLLRAGKLDKAEPYCRQALDGYRRVGGDDHIGTLYSLTLVGRLLLAQGKPAEAQPYFEEAVERRRRINGNDHPDTINAIEGLADVLEAQGLWSDAEPWRVMVQEATVSTSPTDSIRAADAMCALGHNWLQQGRPADAEAPLTEALSMYKASDQADDWGRWDVQSLLGEALAADSARYAEAEKLLLEAANHMTSKSDAGERELQHIAETRSSLAALYDAWQKPEKAAQWRSDTAAGE